MPDSQKMSDPHPTIFILDFSNSSMLRKKLQKYTNKHSPKWCVKNGKLIFSQMDPNGGLIYNGDFHPMGSQSVKNMSPN